MKVIVFEAAADSGVPANQLFCARIWHEGGWHPIAYHSSSFEAAEAGAQKWWDDQLAHYTGIAERAAIKSAEHLARKAEKPAKVSQRVRAVELEMAG
jgi:hypothetical protein